MNRTLVFGGSFDPPHLGHVGPPVAALQCLGFDRLLYVPAAVSPHKVDLPPVPAKHRLAMLHLAIEGIPQAEVSLVEVDREGPSLTIDTLSALRDTIGGEMRLLIGADQARVFFTWHRFEEIIALTEPVVMPRAGGGALEPIWQGRLLPIPPIAVSSSQVRSALSSGASLDQLVPASVAAYIKEHGLYR